MKDARIKGQNFNLEEKDVDLSQTSRRASHALGTAAEFCFPAHVIALTQSAGRDKG